MKLAKIKAFLGLSVFVATFALGLLPAPVPSVTPTAAAAGPPPFILPDGKTTLNLGNNDIGKYINFVDAQHIVYKHNGHSYVYTTAASLCSVNGVNDDNPPNHIYFCGQTGGDTTIGDNDEYGDDGNGATFASTENHSSADLGGGTSNNDGSQGYGYWYWCAATDDPDANAQKTCNGGGSPILKHDNGFKCQSAFVFMIKINNGDFTERDGLRGGYLASVTPGTTAGGCIIKDKGGDTLNEADLSGTGTAVQNNADDEYVSLDHNNSGAGLVEADCTGVDSDGADDNSRNCEVSGAYVADQNLLADAPGTRKALLGISSLFSWQAKDQLVSNFNSSVTLRPLDPVADAQKLKALQGQLLLSKDKVINNTYGNYQATASYEYFAPDNCFDTSKNGYRAAFIVSRKDMSVGQVVSATNTDGDGISYDVNKMTTNWGNNGDSTDNDPSDTSWQAQVFKCLYETTSNDAGAGHNLANDNPNGLWENANHHLYDSAIGIGGFLSLNDTKLSALVTSAASKGGTSTTAKPSASCDFSITNPLTWFLCPLTNLVINLASTFDNLIDQSLCIPVSTPGGLDSCSGNPVNGSKESNLEQYKPAWSAMRGIALGLVVIIGLLAIVSQASGLQIFDAYTVKKIMPRLAFAAIAVSLSWPLLQWFIGLTNDLGFGVRSFIYAPFGDLSSNLQLGSNGIGGFIEGFFASAGILLLGFAGLLSFGATAALFLSVALLALVVRQIAVIGLVIVSPIAIMLYAAPFGQRFAQLWWKEFTQLTFAFPLVAGAIAIGHVFGTLTLAGSSGFGAAIIGFTGYLAGDIAAVGILAKRGAILGLATNAIQRGAKPAFGLIGGYRKNKVSKKAEGWQKRWKSWQQTNKPDVNYQRDANGKLISKRAKFETLRAAITDPTTELKGRIGQASSALGGRLAGLKNVEGNRAKTALAGFAAKRGESLQGGTGLLGAGKRLGDRTSASLVHEKMEHQAEFDKQLQTFLDDKGGKIGRGDFSDYDNDEDRELFDRLTAIKNTKGLAPSRRLLEYSHALESKDRYKANQLHEAAKLVQRAKYDPKMRRADVNSGLAKLYASGGKADGNILADTINELKEVHGEAYSDEVGRQVQEIAVRAGRDDLTPGRGIQYDADNKAFYVFGAAAKIAQVKATGGSMTEVGLNFGNGVDIDQAQTIVQGHMSDIFNKMKSQSFSNASSEMLRDMGFDMKNQDVTSGSGWAMLQDWARGNLPGNPTPAQVQAHQDKVRDMVMGLSLAVGQYGGGDIKQKDTYRNLLQKLDFPAETAKQEAARQARAQQEEDAYVTQTKVTAAGTAAALNTQPAAAPPRPGPGSPNPQPRRPQPGPGPVTGGEVLTPIQPAQSATAPTGQSAAGPGIVYQTAPATASSGDQASQPRFTLPAQQILSAEEVAQAAARASEGAVRKVLREERQQRDAQKPPTEEATFYSLSKEYSPYSNAYDPRNAAIMENKQQQQQQEQDQQNQGQH